MGWLINTIHKTNLGKEKWSHHITVRKGRIDNQCRGQCTGCWEEDKKTINDEQIILLQKIKLQQKTLDSWSWNNSPFAKWALIDWINSCTQIIGLVNREDGYIIEKSRSVTVSPALVAISCSFQRGDQV